MLAGCAGVTPLAELEAQALLTGDWSAVEKRERMQARRHLNSYIRCPPGTIGYCESDFGRKRCDCIDHEIINTLLSGN
jgi:hypothetical protein